jgi:CRISPR-associated protein Cas2
MMVLVTYDVTTTTTEGQTRLRRVAKTCQNYGQRVQHSVFECLVDPAQFVKLKSKLLKVIDEREDSLRFYFLGANGSTVLSTLVPSVPTIPRASSSSRVISRRGDTDYGPPVLRSSQTKKGNGDWESQWEHALCTSE